MRMLRSGCLFAVLVFSAFQPSSSRALAAPPCADDLGSLHWFRKFNFPSFLRNSVNIDSFTFVSDGSTLYRMDLTNPVAVTWTNVGDLGGQGVAFDGERLFFARGTSGLMIVDVADPLNPAQLAVLDTPGYARGIALADGGLVCVADEGRGLRIIDVTTPNAPVELGFLEGFSARSVATHAAYAYLVNYDVECYVVDIADPAAPVLLETLDLDRPRDVLVRDGFAYLSTLEGLKTLDLTDPAHPTLVSSIETYGPLTSLWDLGDVLAASQCPGLSLFDRSSPASPEWRGQTGFGVSPVRRGPYLYVSGGSCFSGTALNVFDMTSIESPAVLATIETPEKPYSVVAREGLALLGDPQGIQIVTTSTNPPTLQSALVLGGEPKQMDLTGDLACIGATNGLHLVDVSDPAAPELLASLLHPNGGLGMAREGPYVYVSNGFLNEPFWVVDISDPSLATIMTSVYGLVGEGGRLAVGDNHLYVASGSLWTVDIANPNAPVVTAVLEESGASLVDVAVSGSHVYAAGRSGGLCVYSISDPAVPVLLTRAETPQYALEVEVVGDFAYVLDSLGAVIIFDVSDPTHPTPIGSRAIPAGRAAGLSVDGGILHVTGGAYGGFHLLPATCSAEAVDVRETSSVVRQGYSLGRPQPNPFSDATSIRFDVSRASRLQLAVFDVTGRRVDVLAEAWFPEGAGVARWDGRGHAGQRVAPGVYFVRLAGDAGQSAQKVTVVSRPAR